MTAAPYIVDPLTGCWVWQGRRHPYGYGWWDRVLAHRKMYEQHHGPIPRGLVLDHLCRNPPCVNPDHLDPVTQRENTIRGLAATVNAARQLARTHCKEGHEYTAANTGHATKNGHGYRRCRVCSAAATRRHYAKRKAAA